MLFPLLITTQQPTKLVTQHTGKTKFFVSNSLCGFPTDVGTWFQTAFPHQVHFAIGWSGCFILPLRGMIFFPLYAGKEDAGQRCCPQPLDAVRDWREHLPFTPPLYPERVIANTWRIFAPKGFSFFPPFTYSEKTAFGIEHCIFPRKIHRRRKKSISICSHSYCDFSTRGTVPSQNS